MVAFTSSLFEYRRCTVLKLIKREKNSELFKVIFFGCWFIREKKLFDKKKKGKQMYDKLFKKKNKVLAFYSFGKNKIYLYGKQMFIHDSA